MIYGDPRETEALGPAGEIVPLANPTATAQAVGRLLSDRSHWERASRASRERVRLYYNKPALDRAYRQLYDCWISAEPPRPQGAG
jgi:glycosyltransferase involved in cell wall biosynthesis